MVGDKNARIQQLENRIDILRAKGEEKNRALINKCKRQLRNLKEEN